VHAPIAKKNTLRMLIILKAQLDEVVATVWLTTTKMGFS
jgi:hypothetical protein